MCNIINEHFKTDGKSVTENETEKYRNRKNIEKEQRKQNRQTD